jgi:enamine deaminase RidA (YjgF/YER057c/UK114 family)
MKRNVIQVKPEKFPWLDLKRYTFSMGVERNGVVYISGQTASTFDKAEGRVLCKGDIAEQTKIAWEKIGVVLEAAGMKYENIVRTVDYVAPQGFPLYRKTADVRRQFLGRSPVASTGVLVHSLLRPDALIEIQAIAIKGRKEAVMPTDSEYERFKELTYAPAVKASDKLFFSGVVELDPNTAAGQAEACYRRIDKTLKAAGASFDNVVNIFDYVAPMAVNQYHEISTIRQRYFGNVAPSLSGAVYHRILNPRGHLEVDVIASLVGTRQEIVIKEWHESYQNAMAAPAVRIGNLVYFSAQSSIDHTTGQSVTANYDLAVQARQAYKNLAQVCSAAGVSFDDIAYTLELTPPTALGDVRVLGQVRREFFRETFPAATGLIVHQNLRPENIFTVAAVALV